MRPLSSACSILTVLVVTLFSLALSSPVHASQAYGSLNNFDCVNDTGVEAHGFEIELDDVRSTDITYTYDYNHYGVPKITQDNTDPAHPKVFVRYAGTWTGTAWTAFTAIPSGPIAPTMGHQFTNPSVNFGGEHFGVGYYGTPAAVKYNWLIDDGTGNLVHGPPVYVATPAFTYVPPAPAAPAVVQAVIEPPPPPEPPPTQFGVPTWVKAIKTTTHSASKVELVDLVDPDPDNVAAKDWTNGEPTQVEVEWKLLQTEFANAANPKGVLQGANEDLPGGDEIITRRYEFYKYIGPLDAETGEAMADVVGPDGLHGVGSVTYADHFDANLGEWVTVTVDTSTLVIVGDFFGAQMSAFDAVPALGLIDHIPDGELNVPYADRTVVVPGANTPFHATTTGALPDGTTLDEFTGIFSGTPTVAGVFTFTVDARDLVTDAVLASKTYTVTIPAAVGVTFTITTSASPLAGGTTTGGGVYPSGTHVTVIATHNANYAFVNWTENGAMICDTAVYPLTVTGNRTLVANFVQTFTVSTSASPSAGGTTTGDGAYHSGDNATVLATANAGYRFVNWTEEGVAVSSSDSYTFAASANRILVANFVQTFVITAGTSPVAGGTISGAGTYDSGGSVTVLASANTGYVFVNWTEAGVEVSTSASYTFTAGANRTLVANFRGDFFIVTQPGSTTGASVLPGQTAVYYLQIGGTPGASGTASVKCAHNIPNGFCTVEPTSLTLSETTPSHFKVHAGAQGNSGAAPISIPGWPNSLPPTWMWVTALTLVLGTIFFSKRRARLAIVSVVVFTALWSSCGGGSSATPMGVYTVSVTATVAGVAKTQSLTLWVY